MTFQKRKLNRWWPASVVLALWGAVVFAGLPSQMIDFEVNYKAATRLLSGETLYPGAEWDGHYEFKYPPVAASLYLPLTFLPIGAAKSLWALFILSAAAASIMISLKLARGNSGWPRFLSILPALVLLRFLLRELQLGQVNSVVALLLLLMTALFSESQADRPSWNKECLAGLAWGLASALKLYPLIFLPYFLLKKKWRILTCGLMVFPAGFLLPAAFYGFSGNSQVHGEWLSTLTRSTPHLLSSQDNISFLAAGVKITGDLHVSLWIWMISAALLGLVLFSAIARGGGLDRPEVLECGLLMLVIPMISPLGWDYTYLLALLGLTIGFKHLLDFSRLGRIVFGVNAALIVLTIYDVLGRRLYARFMSLSLITVFFLIVFVFLFLLRRKRLA